MNQETQEIRTLDFKPFPLFKSGYYQTILGSFGFPVMSPPSVQELIRLEDGNQLCCRMFAPKEWEENGRIVVLLHGMGGSSSSHYIRRMAAKLFRLGYLVYCINRRGCGCGEGLSRFLSHAGYTRDILIVLEELKRRFPKASIQMTAFSIGGNILLKLLGELGTEGQKYLSHAIAVCPLVDIADTVKTIDRFMEKYYLKTLVSLVKSCEEAFPDEEKAAFPKNMTLDDYNRLYIVPKWGYSSVEEYYKKNSCTHFVPHIDVSCDILFSQDDPIIRSHTIESLKAPLSMRRWRTSFGGHMGFLGYVPGNLNIRWMDHQILEWIINR